MMTGAFTKGKGNAEYTYNGFRNRASKVEQLPDASVPDPTREVRYILDMTLPYDNLLMTQGKQNQSFIWGNGLLSANGTNTEDSFHYLQDHLGSPIRLLGDENLNMPLAYDEFGVPKVEASQNINGLNNPFGFTGYQIDNITGLNFAQARYYDPNNSRMISKDWHWGPHNMIFGDSPDNFVPDISAIVQSANLYAYCVNNPLRFIDPSGLSLFPALEMSTPAQLFDWYINFLIDGVSQAAKQIIDDIVQVGKNFFPAVAAGIQVELMRGYGTAFSLEFKGTVDVSFGRYDKTVYSASVLELIRYGRSAFVQENVNEFNINVKVYGFGVKADILGLRSSDDSQWHNNIRGGTPLDLIRELLDPNFQPGIGASIFWGRGIGGRVSWNNAEFRRRLFEGICN